MDKENKKPEAEQHKKEEDRDKKVTTRKYEKEYPENGDNHSAGKEENGALPNNPAENAERKAPEDEDA